MYSHGYIEQVAIKVAARATGGGPEHLDWGLFNELAAVAAKFDVPHSTFSPHMCALTWALARARRARSIVGLGTFVGWPFAWLAGLAEHPGAPMWMAAIDIDSAASSQARKNLEKLGFGERLQVLTADANTLELRFPAIDILFIDVDDPVRGKADYALILRRWRNCLSKGALVLAHDVCVSKFRQDFESWRAVVKDLQMGGPIDLSIDKCGLSVVMS